MKKITGLIFWIFLYKSKNENVLQSWCKGNGWALQQNYKLSKGFFLILQFDITNEGKRTRNNDKLEPVRDIFSIWNQYYEVDMFQVDAW